MMRRAFFLMLVMTAFLPAMPCAFSEESVVADIQTIQLDEKKFIIKIRSSAPLAFDPLESEDPSSARVRLYKTRLGNLPPLESLPFGNAAVEEQGEDLILRIDLNDASYRASARQGDSPSEVEFWIYWNEDTEAPVITDVRAEEITGTTALIRWKTDEPADAQVVFGTSQPGDRQSEKTSELSSEHSALLSGLQPGILYYYHAVSSDGSGSQTVSDTHLFTTASPAFQETGGQVVIEAEHFDGNITRSETAWNFAAGISGYSGEGYVIVPNNQRTWDGNFTGVSPELSYQVRFETPGTYQIWLRARGPGGNDDSVHAGINGTSPSSADRITGYSKTWSWMRNTMDGGYAKINVPEAGTHTFHLWAREDGYAIDKILLIKGNSSSAPAGQGPPESARI